MTEQPEQAAEFSPQPRQDPQPVVKSRVVVTGHTVHVPPQGEPTAVGYGFSTNLESDEQPYRRVSLQIGPEWQPLDLGWLDKVGVSLVVIENLEGTNLTRIPTPEEADAIVGRVVEIGTAGPAVGATVWDDDDEEPPRPGWLVGPGENHRGRPACAKLLRLRCLNGGTARCNITVFPG